MANPVVAEHSVLCPLVTPFDGDGVDHEALRRLIDHVRDGGVDGLVPCGTTGEFASLDDEEYRAVLETTVKRSGDLPVVAGTTATSISAARGNVVTANEIGADAALLTLPYFHTANEPAGQAAFIEAVADDSPLPIYLYNIPACTGQPIDPNVVERVSEHASVVGVKDSGGDFNYFDELVRRTPAGFRVLEGYDSHLFAAVVSGADGGINALSNVLPKSFANVVGAVADGDIARAKRIQTTEISPLFQRCIEHGFAPTCKAALNAAGVLESDEVRPPLVTLSGDARTEISQLVADTT